MRAVPRYLLASGLGVVAVALSRLLTHDGDPTVAGALPPVALAAYLWGVGPGLVATVVAALGIHIADPFDVPGFGFLLVDGTVVSALSGKLKQALDRATANERTLRSVFEASPLPTLLFRMSDGRVSDANRAYVIWSGEPREHVVGRTFAELGAAWRTLANAAVEADGRLEEIEITVQRGDENRTLSLSTEVTELAGSRHCITVFHDITDQRAVAAAFRTAYEQSPMPKLLQRVSDGSLIAVNRAFDEMLGYPPDEKPTDPRYVMDHLKPGSTLSTTPVADAELHLRKRNGDPCDVTYSSVRLELAGEQCNLIFARDVTDQLLAHAKLEASEQLFSQVFQANPLPAAITRLSDRRWLAVNDAFVELFGYTRDEVVGKTAAHISVFVDRAARERLEQVILDNHGLRAHEVTLRTKDGRHITALWSVEVVELDGARALLSVVQDITTQKAREAALRESESRFREIAENIQEVFWMSSPDLHQVHYVSPAYERVWGRPCARLYERPQEWIEAIVPEDRERVSAAALTEDYSVEYQLQHPDGTRRWIADRGFTVKDASGALLHRVGVAKDITEQCQLEDQLRQTQKMESLGMLAGGVAHDFNNVLAVIASCSSLIAEAAKLADEDAELLTEIDHAVERATSLTRQLLAFSRRQVATPKVLDLNMAVQETRKMLRRLLGEDVLLSTSLEPDLGHIRIDPGYLVQVLMNLAVNARDAMPRGGTLSISTRNADDRVLLIVEDTGAGIPADLLPRIFEPFFTTKSTGKGSGMGLAVVMGIVEQAGGTITVESQASTGTTFRVLFPRVDERPDADDHVAGAMALGRETILLVDDDIHVRRTAARSLRSRGYQVLEADNGESALTHVARAAEPIDLLLTDVVMPGMDGRRLAEAVLQQRPQMKVLYTSGYTDDAVVRYGVMHGLTELLEKPYRPDALARRVRQVLDR